MIFYVRLYLVASFGCIFKTSRLKTTFIYVELNLSLDHILSILPDASRYKRTCVAHFV